jgi:mycofactocin glycosyltransferase
VSATPPDADPLEGAGEPPAAGAELAGTVVAPDPSVRSSDDGTVLVGGSPLRVMRLSPTGAGVARRLLDGAPVPSGPGATTLTRRLLDGGLVHPVVAPGTGPPPSAVTIVVPLRGTPTRGLLDALPQSSSEGRVAGVVVVDDASPVPVAVSAEGSTVVRREANGGPGAARNTGLAVVETPYVAFVDADCVPQPGWLDALLPHFGDPLVAAVAPRIVATEDAGPAPLTTLARYEAHRSPLDLGPRPARVRARTRVSYVPSAALVVRTDVLRALGGFDEGMRVGEDVDLVWRLDEAGWTVRYEPASEVAHDHRTSLGPWLRRRFDYGTSAGPLAVRHPGALVPVEASVWSLGVWALAASGHPVPAAGVAATSIGLLTRTLGTVEAPLPLALRLAGLGHVGAGRLLAEAVLRPWWPLALGAVVLSRRARPLIAAAVVAPPLWEWVRDRPRLDPVRWVGWRVADDVAYSTGVWAGAVAARVAEPLVPDLTSWPRPSRYTRWRTARTARTGRGAPATS